MSLNKEIIALVVDRNASREATRVLYFMKETELAKYFIDYLSDYDIYQEVPASGIIDIVAKKGNIITAIEVKKSLNFNVFEQAFNNKRNAHYSYVAVPYARRSSFTINLFKSYGIGILIYNQYGYDCKIKEIVKPTFNRKILKIKLEEWMKKSVAGSKNDRMTAFKNSIFEIKEQIEKRGGKCLISDILNSRCHYHWASFSSAKSSIIEMCNRGVIKEFIRDGAYLIINQNG